MRNLVVSVLFVASLLQAGTGCIIVADDDDDDRGDNGRDDGVLVAITWDCPPEADIVTITASVAGTNNSLSPDTYPCSVGALDLLLDAGSWDIDVLPEADGITFLGLTETIDGVDGELVPLAFSFPQDGGFFLVSWTIEGLAAPQGCNDGETIQVTGTWQLDPEVELVSTFPCEAGEGIVGIEEEEGWPLGEYVLDVALLDANGDAISVPEPAAGVFIDFADELSDIGEIDLIPGA